MKRDYQELINNYQGGDLDLSGCEIKNLELGSISGSLNLSKCVIGKLSIGWVSNTLNMSGAEIKKIEKVKIIKNNERQFVAWYAMAVFFLGLNKKILWKFH